MSGFARSSRSAHSFLRASRRWAFSLVELLVVLGIVSILIAVLLPSLSKAREQANRTRCLSNLNQIGSGLMIYVNDYGEYPVLDSAGMRPTEPAQPIYYAARRSGLLAISGTNGFRRYNLVCPDGWASQGDSRFYEERGISRSGTAYMDYAYWPWRFPPTPGFDVKTASIRYRFGKETRIIVTDVVVDRNSIAAKDMQNVNVGNHGSNHTGRLHVVPRTDGQRHKLGSTNHIQGSGSSVLFSDSHAEWFDAERLTQQWQGMCYPPVDRW